MPRRFVMKMAGTLESIGGPLSLPFAGVHVVERQAVYRPVLAGKAARVAPALQPVLAGGG